MAKIIDWIKNNLRLLEKILLISGSLLIIAVGLVFNIYADTKINITVGYLIYGLLTGIASGVLILVGLNTNLFDVKIGGLICVGLGLVLAIASVFLYPGYLASPLYEALLSKTNKNPLVRKRFFYAKKVEYHILIFYFI